MVDPDQLDSLLRSFQRRVLFRNPEAIRSSKLYHFLYALLYELKNWNEAKLEEEMEKGLIEFCAFYPPYKMNMKIEMKKYDEKDGCFNESSQCSEES